MSAPRLERALAAIGVRGTVEARGSLAVLTPDGATDLSDTRLRDRAVALAGQHGYTHLALELPPAAHGDAAVHRD